jgi:hypothetical protein
MYLYGPTPFDLGPRIATSPVPAPTPGTSSPPKAPSSQTPTKNPENRGSIQVQGRDIKVAGNTIQIQGWNIKFAGNTMSWSWAQDTPIPVREGLSVLEVLWNLLNRKQQDQRTEAYAKIRRYISSAPPYGIPPNFPAGKSFQNRQTRTGTERIDLVVDSGIAFEIP